MANTYTHVPSGGAVFGGSADYSALSPNYTWIHRDLVFFLNLSQKSSDSEEKKRFARAVIILLAFYLESLSNLLFEETKIQEEKLEIYIDRYKDWAKPIIKLLLSLNKLDSESFAACKGLKDLFLIRNQVFAHSEGRSVVAGTGVDPKKGLKGNFKKLSYEKFTNFPNVYSQFDVEHAEKLCEAVDNFLKSFSLQYPLIIQTPES